jgi:peroxiredoxin
MFNPETPPELAVAGWLNTREPLSLERLKGRVVIVLAFQMLCPGCVEHAIPQARRLRARFNAEQVAIIGLHSVFEHHQVMTPAALEVFVSEFKMPFPVAIDEPDGDGMPKTMAAYQMQGTPTLLIFDRAGRLRRHYFGKPDDIMLAAEIMAMAIEDKESPRNEAALIERKLAATLASDDHGHHDHDHGDACGCGHEHHHDHAGAERTAEPPRNADRES